MTEIRVERRLAAILATDVVGYSRLMGSDEEGTLAALKALRQSLIDPKIAEHRGRIVKTTGDGALVEFASTVDAVRCAIDIQRAMPARNADRSPDKKIEFRIGINVGDIIVEDDDIFGDGVNIAARLESISPGRRHLHFGCGSPAGERPGRGRIRRSRRAKSQEHRAAGASLSASRSAKRRRKPRLRQPPLYRLPPRSRCRTGRRSRCCRSTT